MSDVDVKLVAGGVLAMIVGLMIGGLIVVFLPYSFMTCSMAGGAVGGAMGFGAYAIHCGLTGKEFR